MYHRLVFTGRCQASDSGDHSGKGQTYYNNILQLLIYYYHNYSSRQNRIPCRQKGLETRRFVILMPNIHSFSWFDEV
jgi:hypothetical protein